VYIGSSVCGWYVLVTGEWCVWYVLVTGELCVSDRGDCQHQHAENSRDSQPAHGDASSHLLSEPAADSYGAAAASPGTGDHETAEEDQQVVVMVKAEEKHAASDAESGVMPGGHHHATRSLVLILALSLHRIFEGMSIGLQQTVTSVVSLFGAVMCHEMVIGFSLGLQFVRSGFALRRLLVTSLVCSLIMPLGVFIGLVMTEIQSGGSNIDIANGLLQAIAMGTFIYVTFFEILQEEVDSEDTSIGKIVCIAAGFAIMALLDLIPEGEINSSQASYLNRSTFAPPVNSTVTA